MPPAYRTFRDLTRVSSLVASGVEAEPFIDVDNRVSWRFVDSPVFRFRNAEYDTGAMRLEPRALQELRRRLGDQAHALGMTSRSTEGGAR